MINIAASRDCEVINPGALFLVLFWRSKKEQPIAKCYKKYGLYVMSEKLYINSG